MNVNALRRALHACVNLVCDALLEGDEPSGSAPVRPKRRRGPSPEAPIRRVKVSPEARASALKQARRNGVL